jgi:hypothetical protein
MRSGSGRTASHRQALIVGAGGALGAAVLEQALASAAFDRVRAVATQPLGTALRGFDALPLADWETSAPLHGDMAWVVFDRERHANGRDLAFFRPLPEDLLPIARRLHNGGVRRLIVVLPHAPGLLPEALKRGLASLDDQAVAALGFEHLIFMRPAQSALQEMSGGWLQRLAHGVLAQLRWLVPQREQPVRAVDVASFAIRLALELDDATAGTRVVPPELVWQASHQRESGALARSWLATGQWAATPVPRPRL